MTSPEQKENPEQDVLAVIMGDKKLAFFTLIDDKSPDTEFLEEKISVNNKLEMIQHLPAGMIDRKDRYSSKEFISDSVKGGAELGGGSGPSGQEGVNGDSKPNSQNPVAVTVKAEGGDGLELSTRPINILYSSRVEFDKKAKKCIRINMGKEDEEGKVVYHYYAKKYELEVVGDKTITMNGASLGVHLSDVSCNFIESSEFLAIVSRVYLLSKISLARDRMRIALNAHVDAMKSTG